MQITLNAPYRLYGDITLPSSKSISNRALVINALIGDKESELENLSDCDDTCVMLNWLTHPADTINIGAAGTAMRFSSALLAVTDGVRVITGTERMKNRPISVLVDALRKLGATVEYVEKEGYPPLRITGNNKMLGGHISLPGNVSSQYISALLMIAPAMKEGLSLTLTDAVISRPYIDLTLQLMTDFGAKCYWSGESQIIVEPVGYSPRLYFVESDWSASSYWYEMAALSDNAEFVLSGLFRNSYQGDSKVAEIFENLGVHTFFDESGTIPRVVLRKTGTPCAFMNYDFINQPDLAQTLVVCCCMMDIPFRFTGLQSLKIKETDRISALQNELLKLGYVISEENGSVLFWNGEKVPVSSLPVIDTYEDHRMAMAFAPCALKLGEIRINNPEVVSKSYPKYWDDLNAVGFQIEKSK
ncbi:MAG: 3-phosphoshikimate 1-carboxyvinyltransferase [Bacteroides sp.]|nr:3-phosphoshikimate 1-carboxyvinyltransferase [Roseburia sp.]MCM1347137.1 3-phosphoshikimate 1-carboxyvinyltransferase [Bacteroides sp.]MCM1420619.1 3-phosphoshikimate 1-carboxyvinyltransferase [Bacteroides sp.]